MTTGKLAAWGPAVWIAALEPRVSAHRRSSQTISLKRLRKSETGWTWSSGATAEYSANGSFARPHSRSGFCVHYTRSGAPVVRAKPGQKNIWSSLTAD